MKNDQVVYYIGDCMNVLNSMPRQSVDLVLGSPPYEDCREYETGWNKKGYKWIHWAVHRFLACLRVSRGLVCWVVDSPVRNYEWGACPVALMYELKRRGVILRKPPIFHRYSTPGSGGRDWLRNDYEFVIVGQNERRRLPWSDPKAMGHPCKYKPGGPITHRRADGTRQEEEYREPDIANPGNVISLGAMGKGNMGDRWCHENEAPFPERLAEFFVRSFCPPGGVVLDPFAGSGTTLKVAAQHGRRGIGIDTRESQRVIWENRSRDAGTDKK